MNINTYLGAFVTVGFAVAVFSFTTVAASASLIPEPKVNAEIPIAAAHIIAKPFLNFIFTTPPLI